MIERYQIPATTYFASLGRMNLGMLSNYAAAEQRLGLLGLNLMNEPVAPMSAPLEYSPYGAGPVESVRIDHSRAARVSGRYERALVASPATAILGLGAGPVADHYLLLAEAAMPIMAGKAKFFSLTAGVSTDPLTIRSYFTDHEAKSLHRMRDEREREERIRVMRAEKFAQSLLTIGHNYGFINVEDAQGKDLPLIFGALEALRGTSAIWSDDRQGTGVITAAAVLAWAELTGRRDLSQIRGVILGAGAGARGVYDELVNNGLKPEMIMAVDSRGPLHEGRRDLDGDPFKAEMRKGIKEGLTLNDFIDGADFVINLGVKEQLTRDLAQTEEWCRRLAENALFAPMTNPDPGIYPDQVKGVRKDIFYASGNQVFENCVNNFAAFGFVGAGVLTAMAGEVSVAMTVAAARGILEVAKMGPPAWLIDQLPPERREFGRHWLVPNPMDTRLIESEAGAVARAAIENGLSNVYGKADPNAMRGVAEAMAYRRAYVEDLRDRLKAREPRYYQMRYPSKFSPFTRDEKKGPEYFVAPEVHQADFEDIAHRLGVKASRWQHLLGGDGRLKPDALTTVLNELVPATKETSEQGRLASKELDIIMKLLPICPALALALALRRTRVRPDNLINNPTVFHRVPVLKVVLEIIPEAEGELRATFSDLPRVSSPLIG